MNLPEAWTRLSDRDRRAIRLGALVLLPALAWVFAVSPWLEAVESRRSALEARRSLLRAERDLLADRQRYPEAVRAAAAQLQETAPALLDSRSRGVATAGLTQFLEDRAAARRVRLTATEPRPTRRLDASLVAVPLHVEGESDLQGVLSFLESLEEGPKLLQVDGLRIRRRGTTRQGEEEMEVLGFSATVTGYMLFPEARADGDGDVGPRTGVAADDGAPAAEESLAGPPGGGGRP